MKPYLSSCEMLWKPDPNIDAARKLPGWREFHRVCGKQGLFFDHPQRDGRKGYTVTAFGAIVSGNRAQTVHFADGRGNSVVEALEAAYRAAGKTFDEADGWMDRMTGRTVEDDDFTALLADDDFMEAL